MYNRRYIIPGLLVFVLFFTAPFWMNVRSNQYTRPQLAPATQGSECIESVEVMRSEHMRILNEWRDAALREGKRTYVATNGKVWEVSLQNTCLQCHNKEAFCDSCHKTNSVTPYCWDCHITPAPRAANAGGTKK